MDKFLYLVISGAVTGAIYALIASGMALTYATTRIFNLGFGAVAFASAYVYYELNTGLGWPAFWAAAVTLVGLGPVLGWVLNRLILGRLSHASEPAKIMAVVGILIAVPALCLWIVQLGVDNWGWTIPLGNQIYSMPGVGPEPAKVWHPFANVPVTSDQLIVLGVAAVMAAALWFLLRHTRLGLQMRAATDREELASLRGINPARATSAAWIIGTTLACVAGIVGSPILNSLDPGTFITAVFVATAAVVLGNFVSVPLAFIGGLLLGVLQSIVAGYASFASSISGFETSVPFLALLAALVFLGRNGQRVAGSAAEESVSPDSLSPQQSRLRRVTGLVVPVAVLFVVIGFVANDFWVSVFVSGLALSIVSMSYIVVTGLGGMVSLAQAGFVTASGLTTGLLADHYNWPWTAAVIGGIVVATLLGAIVAVPALRVGGLALTLATLALGFLGDSVLFQWNYLSGGTTGWDIARPNILGFNMSSDRSYAVFLFIVLLFVAWIVRNLIRSNVGRQIIALRASEPAAASSGISPNLTKLRLFLVSAAIAGAGGAMLVTADGAANNITYVTQAGLIWLASVVLWGVRRPAAAVLAGLSATLFPALLSSGFTLPSWLGSVSWSGTTSTYLPQVLFGMGAIAMAQNPEGLLAGKSAARRRQRGAAAPAPEQAQQLSQPVIEAVRVPLDDKVAEANKALELRGLCAGYGQLAVLANIDLTLYRGTITALVGANGSGKSTLCKAIAGVVPATSGLITLDERDVTTLPAHRRSRDLLLAPETRGVFPGLTVEENLAVAVEAAADRRRIYDAFPILAERRRVPAGSLSGGEQQILTMAALLGQPPAVLVADEPTLGLAPRIVDRIIQLFEELRAQGTTILIAEERVKRVLDIADQVVLLELGQVVWSGPPRSLKADQLHAIFLGSSAEVVSATQDAAAEDAAAHG